MLDLPDLDVLALNDRLYSLVPTSTFESLMSKLNARFTDNILRVGLNYKFGYYGVPALYR
jgi:hypothetical protein